MTHGELLKTIEELHQSTDDNIIGVGYGYKTVNDKMTDELSIIFTVKEKLPKSQLTKEQLLPQNIDIDNKTISTDVVQGTFELFCDSAFYTWQNPATPPANRNTFRPLIGGISSSNRTSNPNNTGTLGFFAKDNDTNSLIGITNNHVYINDAFICSERDPAGLITNVKGDVISQKYEFIGDDNPIGVVKKYYPLKSPPAYNYIDVSVTTVNSDDINLSTSYNQEGLTASSYPFASTSEIDDLLNTNPLLYSAGRTTGAKGEGTTKLKTYALHNAITINYNKQGVSTTVNFSDLIVFVATLSTTPPYTICSYPIYYGDSGSALIADISGTKKIIGLCFAGSSDNFYAFACRIDRIASLMNISAWNGESVNFSDTSNIMEITVNGLSNSEYIDFEGKRYWQVGLRNI